MVSERSGRNRPNAAGHEICLTSGERMVPRIFVAVATGGMLSACLQLADIGSVNYDDAPLPATSDAGASKAEQESELEAGADAPPLEAARFSCQTFTPPPTACEDFEGERDGGMELFATSGTATRTQGGARSSWSMTLQTAATAGNEHRALLAFPAVERTAQRAVVSFDFKPAKEAPTAAGRSGLTLASLVLFSSRIDLELSGATLSMMEDGRILPTRARTGLPAPPAIWTHCELTLDVAQRKATLRANGASQELLLQGGGVGFYRLVLGLTSTISNAFEASFDNVVFRVE